MTQIAAGASQSHNALDEQGSRNQPRTTRLESRGDRAFIRKDYEKAMRFYERASNRLVRKDQLEWVRMELKMARICNLLQNPDQTISHYSQVFQRADTLLNVEDACYYIDAMRQLDQVQEAEIIARHYAFRSPYNRNQRYLNALNALSNQHHYYAKGDSDFSVELVEGCGSEAEYWLGNWRGQLICAVSSSQMMDPRKIFFHQTEYFSINADGMKEELQSLPREVQNGAAVFSNHVMVVTGINYNGNDRIHGVDVQELFRTQLFYSAYDPKRRGWSALMPLFEHQENACYGHPVLLNDGKTLLFSSDREGGYGGMDLYISHWDENSSSWDTPVNLGNTVNTEGDEIFPFELNGELYFASNGHEGYGGYDIYRANFWNGHVLPGSLWHFPYPVNSVWNDYGLYINLEEGYFISDRRGSRFKDDIYRFNNAETSLGKRGSIGVSQEALAMKGELVQIEGLEQNGMPLKDNTPLTETPIYMQPEEGEILLTLYYDFDRWSLTPESREKLDRLIESPAVESLQEILILGYADEIGQQGYNQQLSDRRASGVAEYLVRHGMKPKIIWEGRGKTNPDMEDYRKQLLALNLTVYGSLNNEIQQSVLPFEDRIALNRTARRVDILVKTK